jgi:hypothetical protein
MAWLPGAKVRKIEHHFVAGKMVKPIRGLVIHITDGIVLNDAHKDLQSLWGGFNNPNQQGKEKSAHFGVARDGEIWQFADTNDVTFGVDGVWGGDGVDNHWLSVENVATIAHKGKDASLELLTGDQMETLAVLLDWLHKTEGVPYQLATTKTERGLGYHRMFKIGDHSCPGDKVIGQLQGILNLTDCGLELDQ